MLRGGDPLVSHHQQHAIQIVPEEDCAFIVAACNAHDSLVSQRDALREALAGIMERVDAAMAQGDEPGKGVAELLTAARSALAKAGA